MTEDIKKIKVLGNNGKPYTLPQGMYLSLKRNGFIKEVDGQEIWRGFETDEEYLKGESPGAEVVDITPEEMKATLYECHNEIIEVLKNYSDLPENSYPIISLWIIGTYIHKCFNTYPFLYLNATKGSGKTRLLKIIEALCWNGKLTNNISEAVLFRTAADHTILIDEFENIGGKDKNVIRELLNSAYKKGAIVERMKKKKVDGNEEMVVEKFDLYTPVAMANIWGMHDVLGDRCIQILLDKSRQERITSLIEDFQNDPKIQNIKKKLGVVNVALHSVYRFQNTIYKWNYYINSNYIYTYTYNTSNTDKTLNPDFVLTEEEYKFFESVRKTGIKGRDLELFFPLFQIANSINQVLFDVVTRVASQEVAAKLDEEFVESRDVSVINFVAKMPENMNYYNMTTLAREFKTYFEGEEEIDKWLNAKWLGRAFRRLKLVRDKRRLSKGIEVTLNITKAQKMLQGYKRPPAPDKEEPKELNTNNNL